MSVSASSPARWAIIAGLLALPQTARADDPVVLAVSVAQHLRVVADGGARWCGPGLTLRLVLEPDSPQRSDPAQQNAMISRLGSVIEQACPQAVWASVAVQSEDRLLASRTIDKATGWMIKATAETVTTAPAASAAAPAPAAADSFAIDPQKQQEERLARTGLRPGTIQSINEILLAQRDRAQAGAGTTPAVQRALDRLWAGGLDRPAPPAPPGGLGDQLSAALKSGPPGPQVIPALGTVYNALSGSSKAAQRQALTALLARAGRPSLSPPELDQRLAAASAAREAQLGPSQHSVITQPGALLRVDHSPSAGSTAVSVIGQDSDGAPERVTFSGQETARPSADGTALQTAMQAEPPRAMTAAQADEARAALNGRWVDQDGNVWEIAGSGTTVLATDIAPGPHRVLYTGTWQLGLLNATHPVDDVDDMDQSLPQDIRQALASRYHPPFSISLEYRAESPPRLVGQWISGQVTYSQAYHTIKIIEDPTWDKRLVLTRGLQTALGGRLPEEGP